MVNPVQHEITVQYNGKEYSGRYHVEGKVLVVSAGWRTMKTNTDRVRPVHIARMILREMVDGGAFDDL